MCPLIVRLTVLHGFVWDLPGLSLGIYGVCLAFTSLVYEVRFDACMGLSISHLQGRLIPIKSLDIS
jgi:hypothetical protein